MIKGDKSPMKLYIILLGTFRGFRDE